MTSALLEALLDREAARAASHLEPEWLAVLRRDAAESIARAGLPGPGNEAWKYSSLRTLERRTPAFDDAAANRAIDPAVVRLPGHDGARIVFVNGVFRADLSSPIDEAGLSISNIAAADPDVLEALRRALAREHRDPAEAFALLNTAFAVDGPIIRVAPGAIIAKPIHVVFVGASADRDIAWHARALVEIGDSASLRVIEHHVGSAGTGPQLGNVVARYALAAGARLDVVQIQDANGSASLIRRSEFVLGKDAIASTHALEIGAQWTRHDLDVDLGGSGAKFVSRGVFALRGRQHADTHLDIRHVARDTTSDIVWRGIADERARGVFHGAITVAAGADGADANLSNKNLLLSRDAEIDTQPVLEIHADEVKAAHGAAVGQLDENALFYLRSRGLPVDAARRLLITAFCAAALADIAPIELREHLQALLVARLPQAIAP